MMGVLLDGGDLAGDPLFGVAPRGLGAWGRWLGKAELLQYCYKPIISPAGVIGTARALHLHKFTYGDLLQTGTGVGWLWGPGILQPGKMLFVFSGCFWLILEII